MVNCPRFWICRYFKYVNPDIGKVNPKFFYRLVIYVLQQRIIFTMLQIFCNDDRSMDNFNWITLLNWNNWELNRSHPYTFSYMCRAESFKITCGQFASPPQKNWNWIVKRILLTGRPSRLDNLLLFTIDLYNHDSGDNVVRFLRLF